MADRNNSENLQNDFFNRARRDKSRVAVFLNSGKKLSGRIKGFDRFTIILDGPGETIWLHHREVELFPSESDD